MDLRKILSRPKTIDIESCLPYGLMFVSREGIILWVNAKFTEYLNLDKGAIVTNEINALFENGLKAIASSAATNSPQYVRYEATGDNYELLAKEVEQGYTVDIRKLDTRVITKPTKEEAVINRNKNTLIVKLASDIKAPIQSIMSFSQSLLEGLAGNLNEKQEKYTSIINKNANDLYYLIDKFSELSRTELGLFERDIKVLDVTGLTFAVTKWAEQLYKDRALSIGFEADTTIKKAFTADENGIKTALQIILDTVVRYMELGDIKVVVSIPNSTTLEKYYLQNGVVISVVCTGFSLSDDEIYRLFDPYAIAESGMKRHVARAMALTCVKNIIEDMGGQIWVTSEVLKNTTFNMLIPIQEREINE